MVLYWVDEDAELVEGKGCSGQTFLNHARFNARHENYICKEDFKKWTFDNGIDYRVRSEDECLLRGIGSWLKGNLPATGRLRRNCKRR